MATISKTISNTLKHWYLPLILGILFIICGIWAFRAPEATYVALSILFSISFIVSGIGDLIFAAANSNMLKGWGWYLVSGLLSLLMGIYLVAYPGISITILPFVVGFTLLFRSFQFMGFSFDLKSFGVKGWGWITFMSVLAVIFSFVLLAHPLVTGISIVVMTALSFIFIGIAYIVLAFNLKKVKTTVQELRGE